MIKNRDDQPPQKEFGELFIIYKPDLKSQDDSPRDSNPDDDEDQTDLRYDLRPEFPSHVPTPGTINLGINNRIRKMFAGNEEKAAKVTTKQRNRIQSVKSKKIPIITTVSPPMSTMKILIASPFSTKWDSDVWNSIKMYNNGNNPAESSPNDNEMSVSISTSRNSVECSRGGDIDDISLLSETTQRRGPLRRMITKPTSRPVGKPLVTKKRSISISPTYNTVVTMKPNEFKEKLILSEETVERIAPTVTVANPKKSNRTSNTKTSSAIPSPLQRKWMVENALNLHTLCQRDENEELPAHRRSFFMPRSPRNL